MGIKLPRRKPKAESAGSPPTDEVREFVRDSAPDFEEARREEDDAGLDQGHGPRGIRAVSRVADLMRMTGWKVLSLDSRYEAERLDIVARKGGSTYVLQCVFGSAKVLPDLMESYVSRYREPRRAVKAQGLMVIFPKAEVTEKDRTLVMLRNKGERVEFFGQERWVDEIRRPAQRRGSTSYTELSLMWVVTAVGAVVVLSALYLGLNFLLLSAGYVIYIFGVVGVIVGTIFKYRNL